jgi:hypothetical protein
LGPRPHSRRQATLQLDSNTQWVAVGVCARAREKVLLPSCWARFQFRAFAKYALNTLQTRKARVSSEVDALLSETAKWRLIFKVPRCGSRSGENESYHTERQLYKMGMWRTLDGDYVQMVTICTVQLDPGSSIAAQAAPVKVNGHYRTLRPRALPNIT